MNSPESAGLLSGNPYPVYALDITNRVQVCTRAATFDAVIHCASSGSGGADTYHQIYLNGARNLLDRFNGSIVVFTSSSSVYAQTDGSWVTEESETKPTRETGRTLLEPENLVLDHGAIVAQLAGVSDNIRTALLR